MLISILFELLIEDDTEEPELQIDPQRRLRKRKTPQLGKTHQTPIKHHHRHHYPVGSITNTNTIATPIDDDDDFEETALVQASKRRKSDRSRIMSEKPTSDQETIRPPPSTPKPRFSRVKQAVTLPKEVAKQELSSKESDILSIMVSRIRKWMNDLRPGDHPLLCHHILLQPILIHPILPLPPYQPRWSACPFITMGTPSRTVDTYIEGYWNATTTSGKTTAPTRVVRTGRLLTT